MANAYFANLVGSRVAVNLNNAVAPTRLKRPQFTTGELENKWLVTLTAISFPIRPNKGKGKLGLGDANNVTITYAAIDKVMQYQVTVDNSLVGNDLYFVIQADALLGQQKNGYIGGIEIKRLVRS